MRTQLHIICPWWRNILATCTQPSTLTSSSETGVDRAGRLKLGHPSPWQYKNPSLAARNSFTKNTSGSSTQALTPSHAPPHPKSSPVLPGRVLTACMPWGWLRPKTPQWVEAQVPQQGRDCKPNALIPTGTLPLAQQSRGPCQPFSHFQNHLGRPKVKVGSGFGEQHLRRHQRDGMKRAHEACRWQRK